jgi:hypothetical protein
MSLLRFGDNVTSLGMLLDALEDLVIIGYQLLRVKFLIGDLLNR